MRQNGFFYQRHLDCVSLLSYQLASGILNYSFEKKKQTPFLCLVNIVELCKDEQG